MSNAIVQIKYFFKHYFLQVIFVKQKKGEEHFCFLYYFTLKNAPLSYL